MSRKPVATDHAVVRYLERVCGVDLDGVRKLIRNKTKHAIASGANSITIDGFRYRLANGRVVTIVPAGRRRAPAKAFREWDETANEDEGDEPSGPVQLAGGKTR